MHYQLATMGRESYATHSAIEKLLKGIDRDGMPDEYTRRTQYRARKALCGTETRYGKLVEPLQLTLQNGKTMTCGIQNPLPMLVYHCEESDHFADLVYGASLVSAPSPETPWRIILYQDGVDPSDGLAKNHSRKSAVFYWTFAEFGHAGLAHEEAWFVPMIVRHVDVQLLDGGLGQCTHRLLERFFNPTHDIRVVGVKVNLAGAARAVGASSLTIFANVEIVLADRPAAKEIFDDKGHSGHKCCALCENATLHKLSAGVPMHLRSAHAVPITNMNFGAFKPWTDARLKTKILELGACHAQWKAGALDCNGEPWNADKFDFKEQVLGYNFNPHSIIINDRFAIKAVSCRMADWAHTYVNDGLADEEFGSCMKILGGREAGNHKTTYKEVGDYQHKFTHPTAHGNMDHLFSDAANKQNLKKGAFTASASEFLALVPILYRFFSKVAAKRPFGAAVVKSLICVLTVVMMLQALKLGEVSADDLATAIQDHLAAYIAAYGADSMRPKHHDALHLPRMLRRFGFLLATFTCERKHRVVKRYTHARLNLTNWSLGSIEEVTCHQIWELSLPFFHAMSFSKPRGKLQAAALKEAFPNIPLEWLTLHHEVKCNGGNARAGDVVSVMYEGQMQVGELKVTVGIEHNDRRVLISMVEVWDPLPNVDTEEADLYFASYKPSKGRIIKVDTETSLDTVFAYMMADARSSCVVCLPYELRRRRP